MLPVPEITPVKISEPVCSRLMEAPDSVTIDVELVDELDSNVTFEVSPRKMELLSAVASPLKTIDVFS